MYFAYKNNRQKNNMRNGGLLVFEPLRSSEGPGVVQDRPHGLDLLLGCHLHDHSLTSTPHKPDWHRVKVNAEDTANNPGLLGRIVARCVKADDDSLMVNIKRWIEIWYNDMYWPGHAVVANNSPASCSVPAVVGLEYVL
jgi:hypothetical protein